MQIKKTFKKLIKWLPLKKSVSVLTSLCFVLSSVFVQGAYSAMPVTSAIPLQNTALTNNIPDYIIPFNLGRITNSLYVNKGDIVINIQDLHSHEQTQRNISSILSILDKKYGLDKIYVEGAVGQVNTKWLSNIKDKNIQQKILDNMLKNGRLTGSEYYAVKSNKNNILQGIEEKQIYINNLKRLNEIYNKKDEIEKYIPHLQYILEKQSAPYYSNENKKLNKIAKAYQNGSLRTDKYISYLIKAAYKANVNLKKYKSILNFAEIITKQQNLNNKKLNKEIQDLLNELKAVLPYAQYKQLSDKALKREYETEFYFELFKKANELELLGKKNFKNAKLFSDYLVLNQNINPVELASNERMLIEELNGKFSRTENEKNIYFLQKHLNNLSGYLNNKLTAQEYEYFETNIQKFQLLWAQYIDIDKILDITKYFELFDNFYKDNVERNRYFIKNMLGKMPSRPKDGIRIKSDINHQEKIVEEISKGKKVHVVITGGFHTYGFNKLLEDEGINYIVITPNITEETAIAQAKYEQIFKEQTNVLYETLQKMFISQIGSGAVLNSDVLQSLSEVSEPLEIEMLNSMLKDISAENIKVSAVTRTEQGYQIRLLKNNKQEFITITDSEIIQPKHEIQTFGKDFEIVLKGYEQLQNIFRIIRESKRSYVSIDINVLIAEVEKTVSQITNNSIKEQFQAKIDDLKAQDSFALTTPQTLKSENKWWFKLIEKTVKFITKQEETAGNAVVAILEAPLMMLLSPEHFVLMHYGKKDSQQRLAIENAIKDNDTDFLEQTGFTTRLEGVRAIMQDTKTSFADSFIKMLGISSAMIFSSVMIGLAAPVFLFGLVPSFIVMFGIPFFAKALPANIRGHITYNKEHSPQTQLSIKQKYEVFIKGKRYITEAVSEKQAFNDVLFRATGGNKLEMYKIREELAFKKLPVKLVQTQDTVYAQKTGQYFQTVQKDAQPGEYKFTVVVPGLNDTQDLSEYQSVYARSPKQAIYKAVLSMFYAAKNGILRNGLYEKIPFTSEADVREIAKKISERYDGDKLGIIIKKLKTNVPSVRTSKEISKQTKKQKAGEQLYKVIIPELNDSQELTPYQEVYAVNKKEAIKQAILAIIMARQRGELEGGYYNNTTINRDNLTDILNAVLSKHFQDIDSLATLQKAAEEKYEQLTLDLFSTQDAEVASDNISKELKDIIISISSLAKTNQDSIITDVIRMIDNDAFLSSQEKDLSKEEKKKLIEDKLIPIFKQLQQYLNNEIPISAVNESISFGTAGKRGIIGEDFNFNSVALIAQAIANIINSDSKLPKAVFIGNDTRFLGKLFSIVMERIFAANKIKVYTVNEKVATPTIACYLKEVMPNTFAASLNVTASHNPKEYNGVKPNMGDGAPALPAFTKQITAEIQSIQQQLSQNEKAIKVTDKDASYIVESMDEDHFKYLTSKLNSLLGIVPEEFVIDKAKNTSLVVDGKHTALMPVLIKLLDYYGFTNVELFNDARDVAFDTYNPEPNETNTKELKQRVLNGKSKFKGKTVFGIATDPDGDRFCIYDSDGSFISPNEVGLIAADKLLSNLISEMKAAKEQGTLSIDEINKFRGVIVKSLVTTFELDLLAQYYSEEFLNIAFGDNIKAKQDYITNYGSPVSIKTVSVGWKNIADGQKSIENSGQRYLMGVESSGGLSVGLYDKDGGLATMMPVLIAAQQGKSFKELLQDARTRTKYKSEFKETAVKFPKEVETDIEKAADDILDITETGSEYDGDERIEISSKISSEDKRTQTVKALAQIELQSKDEKWINNAKTADIVKEIASSRQQALLDWIKATNINELTKILRNLGLPKELNVAGIKILPNEGIQILLADDQYQKGDVIKNLLTFRASGTEPLVRVYAESTDKDLTNLLSLAGENIVKGAYKSFTNLPAFTQLQEYINNNIQTIKELFAGDSAKREDDKRGSKFSRTISLGKGQTLNFDFSRTNIDDNMFNLFINLLKSSNLKKKINDMFKGKKINWTENRAVLHTALRNTSNTPVIVEGTDKNIMTDINAVLAKMKIFSDKIISGQWKGVTGKQITDVVSIGIGGSDLGPRMATDALSTYKKGPNVHFVSNVDPNDINSTLNSLGLNPETTLFIIESKTFTTEETITNANLAKKWITSQLGENADVIAKHFVAVSTNKEKVSAFGIDTDNMFEFWDWVGGRYSVWSAVGLPLMCSVGYDNFIEFLDGAHQIDNNFRNAAYENNIPVIMAVLNILERNLLNRNAYAILPYNKYLKLFTSHIQQVYMESLGKSVDSKGNRINYSTGSEIYGTAGTDAQHSYLQEHHQGTDIIPVDFIGFSSAGDDITDQDMKKSHFRLLANMLAQANAMAFGRTYDETVAKLIQEGKDEATAKRMAKDQIFDGNRPSTVMMFDKLTPRTLGALTALYEDMVAALGIMWDINTFDQMGVELGKVNAKGLFSALQGSQIETDSSTKKLIDIILEQSSKLTLESSGRFANFLATIISRTVYAKEYLRDLPAYDKHKRKIEETVVAIVEAPLMMLLTPKLFVKMHYSNIKYISNITNMPGYVERLSGATNIKKETRKTFLQTLAVSAPSLLITSAAISLLTAFPLMIPALITSVSISLIAAISKNVKEHITYNMAHTDKRLNIPETSELNALTNELSESANDTELTKDIEKMLAAGFSQDSIVKLLKQYLSLRNGQIPEEIYDKKDEIKFGTAGVRGIMGYEFDFLDVSIITQAISNAIKNIASRQGIKPNDIKIVVGGDSRFLSKQFAEISSKIFAANDIAVTISVDDVPSPAISYYTRENKFTLSVNITASHNPKEHNGFKITLGDGGQAGTDVTGMIESEIKNIQNDLYARVNLQDIINITSDSQNIKRINIKNDFISAFIGMITKISGINNNDQLEAFKQKASKWTIIVDPKNGATKEYYPEILKYFGFNVVMMNDTRDVTFSDQKPEPSAANMPLLIKMVKEKAEGGTVNLLGISTDVDGDRFGIVAKNGQYITANEIGLILEQGRIERELNSMIDRTISGEIPLKEFINKKLIIARNVATTHTVDYLAKNMATEIFGRRFQELQNEAKKQGIELNIEELINNVKVEEVNVGFKYMAAMKHKAENEGNLFLLAIESSGGISIAEWIYDKCGFLANIMLLMSLVNTNKQPQEILSSIYETAEYVPAGLESAVRFQEIVAEENPSLDTDSVKKEAQARQNAFKEWAGSATVDDINKLIEGISVNIKAADVQKISDGKNLEGIKIRFSDGSWLLLRLSGTEPLVRVFSETQDIELSKKISKLGEEIVQGGYNKLKNATRTANAGTELFRNIIINSLESLQRIVIAVIFKDTVEYTVISKADDFARIKKAELLAKTGIKVNLVLTDDTALVKETTSRLATNTGKLAFGLINKTKDNLTIYGYEQISGQEISKQEALNAMLKHLNAGSQSSVKILDMPSQLDNISIIETEVTAQQMFTTVGVDKTSISLFADALKKKLNNINDMFIKPSVVASNISLDQIDSYGNDDINRALEQGITTLIVSVNDQTLNDKTETLKTLLQKAHDNGLKVMFNYTFDLETENFDNIIKWTSKFNDKFAQFKENGGIDGIRLDLSENGELAASFPMINLLPRLSQTVSEQNVGSFLAVKMPSNVSTAEYRSIFADNNIKLVVDYNSDFTAQGISYLKAEDIIIDISADKNGIINHSKLLNIFENNKVSMISFDFAILEAIDSSDGTFSFNEISIGKLISSIFETTPDGQTLKGINNGRMFIADREISLDEDILLSLYNIYQNGSFNAAIINSLLNVSFKENISKYELQGFVKGILETTELKKLNMNDIAFDNSEYNNLLMKTLVEYRMTKGTSFHYDDKASIDEVLSTDIFGDELKPKINEIYGILNAEYKDKEETVINILSSLNDNPTLNSEQKAAVLEGLLLMLLGYAQQDAIRINTEHIDNIANIKAILCAA